jgi:general secretion pathway protein I
MSRRCGGFTLIEVLVALAIVALGMAAVLEALSSSANTVLYLRDKMLAQWVGLNQVATVRLGLQPGQIPAVGNTTGDLDYAGRSWHWRQEVTALQINGIVRIDVKVRPAEVKAGDDNGWFATVSGVAGDALAASQGTTPTWGTGGLPGQGGEPCAPGQLGCNNPQQQPSCPPGTPGCQQNPTVAPGNSVPPPPGTPNPGSSGSNTGDSGSQN